MNSTLQLKCPPQWMYYGWYALLVLWMQGNALLNSILVLLALVSLPYYPGAFQRLWRFRPFAVAWACYVGVHLASTLNADHPWQAWIGMGDDLQMASMSLLALVFIRTRQDFTRAAWASFTGFAILGWWALIYHLWTQHSLTPAQTVTFGSLEHVNYAAAFSSVAMFCMLIALIHLPIRRGWIMLTGIIPLAIMQIPLGSRTVLLVFGMGFLIYMIWQRSWKLLIGGGILALILGTGLILTPNGIQQFGTFHQYEAQAEGKSGLPSLQIRIEVAKLLWHLSKGHRLLGIGLRNAGYVDLNAQRAWIGANMPETLKLVWTKDPKWKGIKTYDFNHPFGDKHPVTYDPHSQYAATISESGFLGFAALIFLFWSAWHCTSSSREIKLEYPAGHTVLGLLWIYGISGITIPVMYQIGGIIFFMIVVSNLALKSSISDQQKEFVQSLDLPEPTFASVN